MRFAADASNSSKEATSSDLGVIEFGLAELAACARKLLAASKRPELLWLRDLLAACFALGTVEAASGSLTERVTLIRSLPLFLLRDPKSRTARLSSLEEGRVYTAPPVGCTPDDLAASGLRLIQAELMALISSCEPAARLLEVLGVGPASGDDLMETILSEHRAEFVAPPGNVHRPRSALQLSALRRYATAGWNEGAQPPLFLVQADGGDGKMRIAPAMECWLARALGGLLRFELHDVDQREAGAPAVLIYRGFAERDEAPEDEAQEEVERAERISESELRDECFLVERLGCRPLSEASFTQQLAGPRVTVRLGGATRLFESDLGELARPWANRTAQSEPASARVAPWRGPACPNSTHASTC